MRLRALLVGLALLPSTPAAAQTVVTSAAPERVAVTLYRDPDRSPSAAMDHRWLSGFALVSETRRVSLPAGESVVRFEGVAAGIVPQSAIVTGFPIGIVERNRDAYLLSPYSLLDRSLGARVHLRRIDPATGAVREQEAVVRSGAEGAVVLETATGIEALRCAGLPETLVHDGVPEGLSARPTLSVRTRATAPVEALVTLSYIATGFDWQTNYVVELSQDGRRANLFAWLTLGSNDDTSFVDAQTQAVAGRVNWEQGGGGDEPPPEQPLTLRCWPQGRTDQIPLEEIVTGELFGGEEIVVTGMRRAALQSSAAPVTVISANDIGVADAESFADLKLYRLNEPVTIAARSMKQVAMLVRDDVRVSMVHRFNLFPGRPMEPQPAWLTLVTRNRAAEGLGLPLPAGQVALFQAGESRPLLIGEGHVDDRAVNEDVEIAFDQAPGVHVAVRQAPKPDDSYTVTVTNDRPYAVRFEGAFAGPIRATRRLGQRNGRPLWSVTVPANGRASLRYRMPDDR